MANDGGPAFPVEYIIDLPNGLWSSVRVPGMSLLDHFAGQALAAASEEMTTLLRQDDRGIVVSRARRLATIAYMVADAMIEEKARRAAKATEARGPESER